MIAYSSLTVGEVLDDVLQTLSHYRSPYTIDFITLCRFLEHARREAVSRVMPITVDVFNQKQMMQHGDQFPLGFIRIVRVLRRIDERIVEARYADPREWWHVTNPQFGNKYTMAMNEYPIYTVWGAVVGNSITLRIGTRPNLQGIYFYAVPTDGQYIVEFIANYSRLPIIGPNQMPDFSAPIGIIAELEDVVINGVLMRCFYRLGYTEKATQLYTAIKKSIEYLRERYRRERIEEAVSYQSLPDWQQQAIVQSGGQ